MNGDSLGVGHRLSSDPSQLLAATAFAHELSAATVLWPGMSAADLAHAITISEAGLVPESAVAPLLGALVDLHELDVGDLTLDPVIGDIYNNRDAMLRRLSPTAAGYLHTGRARREASTIGWQLACRDGALELSIAVADLIGTIADVAEREMYTVMPDFTYLHRAHPTSLAHYLLGHAAPLVRHLDRIEAATALIDSSPAGAGSTNGSRLPIDRGRLAELLAFESMVRHTRDAMWAPDMALDLVFACQHVMVSIDRLAEELQLWTTEAFGFLEIGDDLSRTSVIMPHKKNPYSLTHLRGSARHALGVVTGLTATMLTASGQPDNRTFAYRDVPDLVAETARNTQLLAAVLAGARFDRASMMRAADDRFAMSTEICDHLSLRLVDNRTSHDILGRTVRAAIDAGRDGFDLPDLVASAAELDTVLDLDQAEFDRLVNPAAVLEDRVTPGGAAPAEVAEMIADDRRLASAARQRVEQHSSVGYTDRLITVARSHIENFRSPRQEPCR